MIPKTRISEVHFNYHSVFVLAVSTILEGERDYGEQTLATLTLQRSRVLRGVVNVVLVRVKVQGVKSELCCERQKRVLYIMRSIFAHNQQTLILYFIVLCGPGSHSRKVCVWLRQNNYMQIHVFCNAQMCRL